MPLVRMTVSRTSEFARLRQHHKKILVISLCIQLHIDMLTYIRNEEFGFCGKTKLEGSENELFGGGEGLLNVFLRKLGHLK